jgi:hypothetical protein
VRAPYRKRRSDAKPATRSARSWRVREHSQADRAARQPRRALRAD